MIEQYVNSGDREGTREIVCLVLLGFYCHACPILKAFDFLLCETMHNPCKLRDGSSVKFIGNTTLS